MAELPERWILKDAFESVVLEPLHQDTETLKLLQDEFEFDKALREEKLDRGCAPCDTERMALWYCYTYMLMHLGAYRTVITQQAGFFDRLLLDSSDELLMIDFGCGPLTAPLAIAEHIKQIPCGVTLSYIGIDNMEAMLQKASEFASNVFSPDWTPIFVISWDQVNLANLVKPKKIVFNFSYFFGQVLMRTQIQECAKLVMDVLLEYKTDDAHLVYLNKDNCGYQYNYHYFKELMNLPIEFITPINYRYRRFRKLKFSDIAVSGHTLHHEILKLDWREYQNS
jgi:SAM-dependent methyltransferase